MPTRTLTGTTTDLYQDDSSSKDGQHGSVAGPMSFKIPFGRTGVRQGRSAGGFDGVLPSPSNPLRAPSSQIAQVHFELRNGNGARQQPNLLRHGIIRSGGHVESADVHQEATRHHRVLERDPVGFTRRAMGSVHNIAEHQNVSASTGGMSSQGPARTRGPGPEGKTRAFSGWRATQQR